MEPSKHELESLYKIAVQKDIAFGWELIRGILTVELGLPLMQL